jgi:hypothetical protein
MDEFVDLRVVNLDGETAITGPPARSTSPHSLCGGLSCNNGFGRYVVY